MGWDWSLGRGAEEDAASTGLTFTDVLFGFVISIDPADYFDQRFHLCGDGLRISACFNRLFE